MGAHAYVNPFGQCHPGNPLCVPVKGSCQVCGAPEDAHPTPTPDETGE